MAWLLIMIESSGLCHFKALNLLFLNIVLNTACSDCYGRYCNMTHHTGIRRVKVINLGDTGVIDYHSNITHHTGIRKVTVISHGDIGVAFGHRSLGTPTCFSIVRHSLVS